MIDGPYTRHEFILMGVYGSSGSDWFVVRCRQILIHSDGLISCEADEQTCSKTQ